MKQDRASRKGAFGTTQLAFVLAAVLAAAIIIFIVYQFIKNKMVVPVG